ncbi:MAG: ImmA/IrrE family metallo-endopeptidase [Saprospiraceae bacterium]|nr:ImmA/IrrE family metallo-endopeptidase [Saprospiraceae bacterium]
MKELISKRIKSARLLARMSLRELSDAMKDTAVSHNAIQKYENAEMMPDSKVLLSLSNALGVKADYFFMPYNVEVSKIEFRKSSKLSIKDIGALKEEVRDTVSRYLELENYLDISSSFQNPIAEINIQTDEDVEKAVNQLLSDWQVGINALPNVIDLLEDKEIKVVEIDAPEGFDGFSGWANTNIPLIVISKNYSVERKRFTSLHELGHLLLNFHPKLSHKDIEKFCHRFAGAMLIPERTFYREFGKNRNIISINELIAVKETYGVSIQAIMARAKALGVINEATYKSFCIKVNQNPDLKMEKGYGEYPGKENSYRFKQLLYRAVSMETISMSKAANLANQKLAAFRDEYIEI